MNQESTGFDPRESFKKAFDAHRSGDLDLAETIYRKILSLQPENAHATHLLGLIALQKGRANEACELFEAAIRRDDSQALFHCNLGEAYRLLARLDEAEQCFLRALELQPTYPQALTNLGVTLHQRGRYVDAVSRFQQALEAAGASADGYSNLGLAQFAAGAVEEAVVSLRKAIDLDPHHLEANNNLGTALLEKGDLETAAFVLEEAVRADPRSADAWCNLARARLGQSEPGTAEECIRRAIELAPEVARFHLVLGQVLRSARRPDEAESSFRRSIELDPDQATTHFVLGTLFVSVGRFEEAEASLESALMLNPKLTIAQEALSQIHSYGIDDLPQIERLERFAEGLDAGSPERMHLEFALANMLDDCKQYDRAFYHLQAGNLIKRSQLGFDAAELWKTVEDTQRAVDRRLIEQKASSGSESDIPILIVGLPCSGTTLVEQILASHPEISGAGELGYLHAAARSMAQVSGTPYPACLTGVSEAAIQGQAAGYLERLEQGRSHARHVTDSQPYNFVHLGLCSMLFPSVRIVHCVRDPMDTCFSIFCQNFESQNEFAYDLEHIAAYYRFYRLMMAHWHSALPSEVVTVSYDDLAADHEAVTRRLLARCQLRWDERCLRPGETHREILTSSQGHLWQPLYSSSVSKWRCYERHLGPLVEALRRDGYAAKSS